MQKGTLRRESPLSREMPRVQVFTASLTDRLFAQDKSHWQRSCDQHCVIVDCAGRSCLTRLHHLRLALAVMLPRSQAA